MFTGLVQKVGKLAGIRHGGMGRIVQIRSVEPWEEPLQKGESIAVQGCCLTVTQIYGDGFDADMPTPRRTPYPSRRRSAIGGYGSRVPGRRFATSSTKVLWHWTASV